VSAGVVARGSRESRDLRRLEKGRPRPVGLTPRQEVLLAEMRRADPDAYKAKRRSLDVVYKERLTDFREHRKERSDADRVEAQQAKLEFIAQKKTRKAHRKEDMRARKFAKAEARVAAKAQRKADRKEAKLLAKKEKALGKKRAKLDKLQAKADKKQAKIDTKAAKAQTKADKVAAREAKKAEKAARKAQK